MKEEKQYKILPNGKCKAVNPFKDNDCGKCSQYECQCLDFGAFVRDNPPMDYIPHPEVKENDVVSGDPVWQWDAGMKLEINWEVIPEWKARKLQARGLKTRQVIELHPEKKEEKQNSENVIAYTGKGVGESNKLIAEFMGYKVEPIDSDPDFADVLMVHQYVNGEKTDFCYSGGDCDIVRLNELEVLPFNYSWDWLMPVVEKIASLGGDTLLILNAEEVVKSLLAIDIKHTYQSAAKFIEWYNTNQQTS